jgi:hypothetical protein
MGATMLAVALTGFRNCEKNSLIYEDPASPRIHDLPICLGRPLLGHSIGTPAALRKAIVTALSAMTACGPTKDGLQDGLQLTGLELMIMDYTSVRDQNAMERVLDCARLSLACIQSLELQLFSTSSVSDNIVPRLLSYLLQSSPSRSQRRLRGFNTGADSTYRQDDQCVQGRLSAARVLRNLKHQYQS